MADLTRSAKQARLWGPTELRAFHIEVVDVDTETFFGTADLPPPTLSDVILNNATLPEKGYSRADERFFRGLRLAFERPIEEHLIIKFSATILQLMDYDVGGGRLGAISRLWKLKLLMCGKKVTAKVDLGVSEISKDRVINFPVLGQENLHGPNYDAEAHLIATAIAAFYTLNQGLKDAGLPEVPSKQYPCFVTDRSAPTFYKITVTKELSESVATGQYPVEATIVERLQVASLVSEPEQGLKPLADRYIILQCFEALKRLLD